MSEEETRRVLQCWFKCPHAFSDGYCKFEEEQYCKDECWSRAEVRNAVRTLLETNN